MCVVERFHEPLWVQKVWVFDFHKPVFKKVTYVGFLLICYISIWDTLYIVYWWVTNSSSWYSSHIVLHQHGKYNRLKTFLKKQTFLFLWACVFTINLFDFQLWNISWKSKSIKIEMLLQKISTFCLAHARLAF